MVNFYIPETLQQALEIRGKEKAIVFAGGTDLMVRARVWFGVPSRFDKPVVYIGKLKELKGVSMEDGVVRIKAATSLTDLLDDPIVPQPLKDAVSSMAAPAIRNMGTIGGNICNASPAGDTLPVLYTMDAVLTLQSASSTREVPINEFILGPGKTAIQDDEILTEISFKVPKFDVYTFRKVGTRKANALSKLSFMGMLAFDGDRVADFRAAFGAVAPTVVRSRDLELKIIGKSKDEAVSMLPELLEDYSELIRPIDDQRSTAFYRKNVSLRLLEHFLKKHLK